MHVLASLKKKSTLSIVLFLFIFGFYLFTRLFLFSKEGGAAFGYDTGIYRHYIQGYYERVHDESITPFGFSGFSNFLQKLGVTTDNILLGWYLLLAVVMFFVFFLFVQVYSSTSTALLASFLFSISVIQYEFFWWFYYRNFFALILFFLAFIFLKYRSYLIILPLVALGTLHILTLFPIAIMMVIVCIFQKEQKKFYFISGSVALGAIVLLNFKELLTYVGSIQKSGARVDSLNPSMSEFNGQFIDISFFWKHTVLYLFFGIMGLVYYFKKYLPLAVTFFISFLPIVFGVLFYRRYYVFLDAFLIFFASIFLFEIIRKMKSYWITAALGIFLLIAVILNVNYVVHKRPLLSHDDLNQIIATNEVAPASLIAVSSATAPWLYGFTHHKIIAPGIFEENRWSQSEWQEFWTTSDTNRRHELLQRYSTPLYIFLGAPERGFEAVLIRDSHFTQKGPWLWQYLP